MRKSIFLLLALAIGLTSCERAILKRTKVKIISDDMIVNADVSNDGEKYLENVTEDEIKQLYIQTFQDELGRGKIDIVTEGEDYVVTINHLHITEYVEATYEEGEWFDLSTIQMRGEYVVTEAREDIPHDMTIEKEVDEDLEESKKGKGKDKGGDPYISGFGGLEGALNSHASEVRGDLKRMFRLNQ